AKAGVEAGIATVQGELAALGDRIELAALDVMEAEAARDLAELAEAAKAYASRLAPVCAARSAIAEQGRELLAAGRQEAGMIWLRRAEAMGEPPLWTTLVDDPWSYPAAIDAARVARRSRFDELIK
ncbi:MAG: hypothetical protein WBF43_08910, partial [Methylocella sp.]